MLSRNEERFLLTLITHVIRIRTTALATGVIVILTFTGFAVDDRANLFLVAATLPWGLLFIDFGILNTIHIPLAYKLLSLESDR